MIRSKLNQRFGSQNELTYCKEYIKIFSLFCSLLSIYSDQLLIPYIPWKDCLIKDHGTDTLDANGGQQAHFDSQNKVGWQQLTPIYSVDGETLIP